MRKNFVLMLLLNFWLGLMLLLGFKHLRLKLVDEGLLLDYILYLVLQGGLGCGCGDYAT
jgi:hypothetical protein